MINLPLTLRPPQLFVVSNPTTDNTETPASVAPDVAHPPSNIAELNTAATDEAAAPLEVLNPTTDNTETPANVAPYVARPPSNIAELNPVPNVNTRSGPATIVSMILGFGFTFASGEESRPVDEQCEHLTIGSLRQVAAYFGTPMYEQNKNELLLRKFAMTALNDRGMLVQEGLEWFFDPKLNAPPDGSVAESLESTQAERGKQLEAAEPTQATMRKQIQALQRELAAVKD